MNSLFNQFLQAPEQIRFAFIATVFLAVALFLYAVMRWINRLNEPEQRRIREVVGHSSSRSDTDRLEKMLGNATPFIVPKESKELSKTLERLHHAGYNYPNAATIFYGLKIGFGLILGATAYFFFKHFAAWGSLQLLTVTATATFLGMFIPNIRLSNQVSKRQDILRKGFPDALDLLVVSVEAGLGFNAALARVSREISITHPQLAQELNIVNDEIRAGVDRSQALRNLYSRTGLEDVQGLTTLIAQSLRFGTSIANALRVYSEEYRDRRLQKAEEQAAKIGTKLIFYSPLIFINDDDSGLNRDYEVRLEKNRPPQTGFRVSTQCR